MEKPLFTSAFLGQQEKTSFALGTGWVWGVRDWLPAAHLPRSLAPLLLSTRALQAGGPLPLQKPWGSGLNLPRGSASSERVSGTRLAPPAAAFLGNFQSTQAALGRACQDINTRLGLLFEGLQHLLDLRPAHRACALTLIRIKPQRALGCEEETPKP